MHCLCFEGSPWSLTKMHNQHYWILLICEGYLPPPLSPHVLLTHLCAVHWVGGVVAHGSWPQMLTTLKDRSWFDPANGAKHDWHCLTHLDTPWRILTDYFILLSCLCLLLSGRFLASKHSFLMECKLAVLSWLDWNFGRTNRGLDG